MSTPVGVTQSLTNISVQALGSLQSAVAKLWDMSVIAVDLPGKLYHAISGNVPSAASIHERDIQIQRDAFQLGNFAPPAQIRLMIRDEYEYEQNRREDMGFISSPRHAQLENERAAWRSRNTQGAEINAEKL